MPFNRKETTFLMPKSCPLMAEMELIKKAYHFQLPKNLLEGQYSLTLNSLSPSHYNLLFSLFSNKPLFVLISFVFISPLKSNSQMFRETEMERKLHIHHFTQAHIAVVQTSSLQHSQYKRHMKSPQGPPEGYVRNLKYGRPIYAYWKGRES